ncbi:hypothetical protein A9762_12360 [Pandoraea sp. ISTKB]|nr:hypothetical protein A9762_12360 [Pandoraea sp. ISTKB]
MVLRSHSATEAVLVVLGTHEEVRASHGEFEQCYRRIVIDEAFALSANEKQRESYHSWLGLQLLAIRFCLDSDRGSVGN